MDKEYWSSIEERNGQILPEPDSHKEDVWKFIEEEGGKFTPSRRDFLKLCGFSIATAAIASSCQNPVNKAVPFLNRPEELVPGKANYYTSVISGAGDYCPVVVKVRDGRPIKIEGNHLSTFSGGGTIARIQASVLGLYDNGARYKNPMKEGKDTDFESLDTEIKAALKTAAEAGEKVLLITSSLLSPSTQGVIDEFIVRYPVVEHVSYDSFSASAMLDANLKTFGIRALPRYDFSKASLLLAINADFLGGWISPVEHINAYAARRAVEKDNPQMLRHIQIESWMSLSGANADLRLAMKPSEAENLVYDLFSYIASKTGVLPGGSASLSDAHKKIADELIAAAGKSIFLCGSNNPDIQALANGINHCLGNYGKTLHLNKASFLRTGSDAALLKAIEEMKGGKVAGLMLYDCNPLHDATQNAGIAEAMKHLKWSLSFSEVLNETAEACTWVCPVNHPLESWNDAIPCRGLYSIAQPTIRPIFNTRQFQQNLLIWSDSSDSFETRIKDYCRNEIFPKQQLSPDFESFWINCLQRGEVETEAGSASETLTENFGNLKTPDINASTELEWVVFESTAMGWGMMTNNPWLLELPDPITKISWDNALLVSPATAEKNSLETGKVIEIGAETYPVLIQPGMPDGVFAVSTGYGRLKVGKAGSTVGKNGFVWMKPVNGYFRNWGTVDSFRLTGKRHEFAFTQRHSSQEGRGIVRETTLDNYRSNPASGNEEREALLKRLVSLYPPFEFPGHHWGLAIDLNRCVGCSNCVISCQAENNIPTVGKENVRNTRIMHWIRVDRYYNGSPENPSVVFQPIMCQQCDNAPCENVCPVSATMHSDEGLNQMAYNRCVGTRYCINNCPYKQRRFNWFQFSLNKKFDYHMNSDIGRLVLNPDVTVRERGVVEKCTFCVQRIQEKKLDAKLQGRMLADGEIEPACMQSCPAKALVFGDMSDPESRVSKMLKNERNYHLLEELHTLPSVGYLTKIRNTADDETIV